MPEGHTISVKRGHGVVTPASGGAELRAAAICHYSFTLSEVTWWIGGKPSGITNASVYGWAGRGIADGSVSILINGYAGHPAPQPVVTVAPVLLLNRCSGNHAASNIELIPSDYSRPVRVIQHCGLVSPQRFRAVAKLVNDRRHDFIAQGIELLRRSLLWHKVVGRSGPCLNERIDCDVPIRGMVGAKAER